jgi:hypothetical protein
MKQIELWQIYVRKNPSFEKEGGTVTITTESLKRFFDQAYEQGYQQGQKESQPTTLYNPFADIFK